MSKDTDLFNQTQCKLVGEWEIVPETPNSNTPQLNICDNTKMYLDVMQNGRNLNISGFFNTTGTFSDDIIFFNDVIDTTYIEYRYWFINIYTGNEFNAGTNDTTDFVQNFLTYENFGPDYSNYVVEYIKTYIEWEQLSFPNRIHFIDDNTIKFTINVKINSYNKEFSENVICYRK